MKTFKVKHVAFSVIAGVLWLAGQANAAQVSIKLVEPTKFTDIHQTGQSRVRSAETVKKDLQKLFDFVASKHLSEGQILKIEVTQIDLAGYIDYVRSTRNDDIRVVKELDPYRVEFNYQLVNAGGEVIKSGEAQLKDFVTDLGNRFRIDRAGNLSYMQKNLEKWFVTELAN